MAIDIHFTQDGQGIVLQHSGSVNGPELAETIRQAHEDTRFPFVSYWISDRTYCEKYDVSPEQVEKVAEQTRAARDKNPQLLVALVSPNALQFGISRMLQGLTDEELTTTLVCESREEADAWVAAKLSED